jgi:hypothetical protein
VDKWDEEMAARLLSDLYVQGFDLASKHAAIATALRQAAAEQREADARKLEEWAPLEKAVVAIEFREAARRLREGEK